MKMGSSNSEKHSKNGISESQRQEILEMLQRPRFYPCHACGRRFTQRALEIHKLSCSEKDDCSCNVCKCTRQGVWDGDFDLEAECSGKDKDLAQGQAKSAISSEKNKMETEFLYNSEEKFVLLWSDTAEHKRAVNIKVHHANTEDHEGDACNRKLFCCVCKEHVFWESYGVHVLAHCKVTENKYVTCPECSTTYSKPTLFLIHFYIHVSNHPLDCPLCLCSYPKCIDATNRAILEHCYAESAPYHCYICLKHFGHCQTVVNHMRLHSKEMPFLCKECNRSFRQIGNLQRHMTTHRGERPHKCPNCCRSFADPATLRNHVRVHTGETPYVCSICKRGFSQVGNLKRHMALHLHRDAALLSEDSKSGTDDLKNNTDDPKNNANDPKNNGNDPKNNANDPKNNTDDPKNNDPKDPKSNTANPENNPDNPEDNPDDPDYRPDDLEDNPDDPPPNTENGASKETASDSDSDTVIAGMSDSDSEMAKSDAEKKSSDTKSKSGAKKAKLKLKGLRKHQHKKDGKIRVFPCPTCGKVYTWQHDLTIHFRTHTGEKPFKCDFCEKRFAQSGAVNIHKARHHSDRG